MKIGKRDVTKKKIKHMNDKFKSTTSILTTTLNENCLKTSIDRLSNWIKN